MRTLQNTYGLTLLELMVVTAILAMGTIAGAWGMNSLLPDLRLRAAVSDLKSDLHNARLIAIKQNTFIVSEFNTVNNSYTVYIDDGGGDSTKAHNYLQDAGEKTVKSVRMHPQINLFKAKFGSVAGKFAFNNRGTLDGLSGGVYLKSMVNTFRGVAVSRIGEITIKASADGHGWHRLD